MNPTIPTYLADLSDEALLARTIAFQARARKILTEVPYNPVAIRRARQERDLCEAAVVARGLPLQRA